MVKNINKLVMLTLFSMSSLLISSCSVYKAASNKGICESDIEDCTSKECFLSHGMEIVDRHDEPDGRYVETYRAQARKSGVTYARAVGHGVADVATFGLWEVVGTPVEGSLSNNTGFITVKAFYPYKGASTLMYFEVYDAYGKRVK